MVNDLVASTNSVSDLTNAFLHQLKQAQSEIDQLKFQLWESEQEAQIDQLTQVGNRRAFDQQLQNSLQEFPAGVCLLMIDLDHFKQCNDDYGHLIGDKILHGIGFSFETHAGDQLFVEVALFGSHAANVETQHLFDRH